jgi:hypothetical protein
VVVLLVGVDFGWCFWVAQGLNAALAAEVDSVAREWK